MATSITINITRVGSYIIQNNGTISGNLIINGVQPGIVVIFQGSSITSSAIITNITINPGNSTFQLLIDNNFFSPLPSTLGNVPATFRLTFNSTPITGPTGPTNLTNIGREPPRVTGTVGVNVACLHGSSLISMKEGFKRLDQIKEGDQVISFSPEGKQNIAKVLDIAYCWLTSLGDDHDAIIFEKDSLGSNQPTQRLIIDPGHPMCIQQEYNENGYDALRPAGSYWEEFNNKQITTKKWVDVFIQEEPSIRYDLILEEPFNTYIANGIVVRSKGYKDHRYKEFV